MQTRYGQVALVDTPGFDDTTVSDEVILAKIAAYLEDLWVSLYFVFSESK